MKAQRLDSIRKLEVLISKVQSFVLWRDVTVWGFLFCFILLWFVLVLVWVFLLIPMYPWRYSIHEKSVLVILVLLNRGVKPINTLELHCVAVQSSILRSTDRESSCFTVLKVKRDLLRLLGVIVCRDSCGKNFDSSNTACLVIHWIPYKGFVEI